MADNSKVAGIMANLASCIPSGRVSVVLPDGSLSGVNSIHYDNKGNVFMVTEGYVKAFGLPNDAVVAEPPEDPYEDQEDA